MGGCTVTRSPRRNDASKQPPSSEQTKSEVGILTGNRENASDRPTENLRMPGGRRDVKHPAARFYGVAHIFGTIIAQVVGNSLLSRQAGPGGPGRIPHRPDPLALTSAQTLLAAT
jgi:hypothetical protein